jgi:tRNA(adenine34) deaminase
VNYELFMGEALAEARLAVEQGERPCAAVAVVDEAMVARARDRVHETGDPTAHAVMGAIREAARRLGRDRLADVTIFTTVEPCAMCVGALLQADVGTLVFAAPDTRNGAAGGAIQLAQGPGLHHGLRVVSGIRREEVEDLRGQALARADAAPAARLGT